MLRHPSSGLLDPDPYDALLLVGFGGPERPEDVVPFLRNVTAGKGIPDERLAVVGEHYFLFGGKSPINEQTQLLVSHIEADLARHGVNIPVYWGCRNWTPYLADTVQQMRADGVRRALAFTTSAYSSYSGCRQYRENLHDAVATAGQGIQVDRARAYFNHPGYTEAVTDAVLAGLQPFSESGTAEPTILFVTHSIPEPMDLSSGPEGRAYSTQHTQLMGEVLRGVQERSGQQYRHELVFCSRSGPPNSPWLEPDVNDRMRELAQSGTRAVLLVPFGFISDHMEVIYDLDTEARATADQLGIDFGRAATAGVHPAFVGSLRELLLERAAVERGEPVTRVVTCGQAALDRCPTNCCPNPRLERPALGGLAEVESTNG